MTAPIFSCSRHSRMRATQPSVALFVFLLNLPLMAQEAPAETTSNDASIQLTSYDRCLLFNTINAPNTKTAAEIRLECEALLIDQTPDIDWDQLTWQDFVSTISTTEPGAVSTRAELEGVSKNSSFVLTPHRPNYLLPASFANSGGLSPFEGPGVDSAELDKTEVQFQLSLKSHLSMTSSLTIPPCGWAIPFDHSGRPITRIFPALFGRQIMNLKSFGMFLVPSLFLESETSPTNWYSTTSQMVNLANARAAGIA